MREQRTKFDNKIRVPRALQLFIMLRLEVTDVNAHAAAAASCGAHPVESKRRRRNSQRLERTKQGAPVAPGRFLDRIWKGETPTLSHK